MIFAFRSINEMIAIKIKLTEMKHSTGLSPSKKPHYSTQSVLFTKTVLFWLVYSMHIWLLFLIDVQSTRRSLNEKTKLYQQKPNRAKKLEGLFAERRTSTNQIELNGDIKWKWGDQWSACKQWSSHSLWVRSDQKSMKKQEPNPPDECARLNVCNQKEYLFLIGRSAK